MAWISLTEADVLTVLSGPELAAYRSKALAAGQDDPLAETMEQVVNVVRMNVAGCTRNRLGAGDTIPEELVAPALDLIAWRLPMRVNINPSSGRRELSMAAVAILDRVANCQLRIAPPEEADTTVPADPAPTISAADAAYGRNREDGV